MQKKKENKTQIFFQHPMCVCVYGAIYSVKYSYCLMLLLLLLFGICKCYFGNELSLFFLSPFISGCYCYYYYCFPFLFSDIYRYCPENTNTIYIGVGVLHNHHQWKHLFDITFYYSVLFYPSTDSYSFSFQNGYCCCKRIRKDNFFSSSVFFSFKY